MALPPQQKASNRSGSGFTNLNRYLQANQSNRLGQTVSAGVQQAGQGARTSLTEANKQFQEKAAEETNRLQQQEQKVGQVLGNVAGATDDDVKTFENVRGAQSLGPTGIADANALRSKAGEAEALGRAGGSEAGRFGLLQRFVGANKPQYQAGSQRLDQMLLGQTGQQDLRSARASTFGLGNEAERNITGAAARGDELKGSARQLAESTIGRLGDEVTSYDAAMQQKLAQEKDIIAGLLGNFGSPTGNTPIELNDKILAQLREASQGVLDEGTTLYGADISPYLKFNELYATKQGVQEEDDLAKLKKLAALTGSSLYGKDQGNVLQDYAGREDMAGSYYANNPFDVTDASKMKQAIDESRSEYEARRAAEQNRINQAATVLAGGGPEHSDSYASILSRYAQDKAKEQMNTRLTDLRAKQNSGQISPQEAQELNQLMNFSTQNDPSVLTQFMPDWAKGGAIDAARQKAITDVRLGGTYGPSGMYDSLQNAYAPLQQQIQAARDAGKYEYAGVGVGGLGNFGNIQKQLDEIQAAQTQYNTVLPEQFNVLRALRKTPTPEVIS